MKKLINILAIVFVLVIYNMQYVNAQVDISVGWTTDCPHTCTTQENCIRYVEYTIYEVCGENLVRNPFNERVFKVY
jgi:hypothetical protein